MGRYLHFLLAVSFVPAFSFRINREKLKRRHEVKRRAAAYHAFGKDGSAKDAIAENTGSNVQHSTASAEGAEEASGRHIASDSMEERHIREVGQTLAASDADTFESGAIEPGDPNVVFLAVKCVWMKMHGGSCAEGIDYSKDRFYLPATPAIGLGAKKCKVHPHLELNSELAPIREQWKAERQGTSFLSKATPDEQAAELVALFEGYTKVTQGSRSGSNIFMTQAKDLFLKSEGKGELDVFKKQRKKGSQDTFAKDYTKRILGSDTPDTDKVCHRSTMQRFLVVFTVACRGSITGALGNEMVWMIFTNVSPLWEVPKPLHAFDLKASRDSSTDCHAKKWTGEKKSSVQGYLGDFLALYREPLIDSECSRDTLKLDVHDETRKVCLMNALHKDLRLLNWYNLVDYSYLVTVHEYKPDRDDPKLQEYSSLLRIKIGDQVLVLTIGLIDLLKDWDSQTGIKVQHHLKVAKHVPGTYHSIFGQKKFAMYPFYLFCLAVDVVDPYCAEDGRGLQLLSECGGDDPKIQFPDPEATPDSKITAAVEEYMNKDNYCELVNSCSALLRKPKTVYNLGVCMEQACKILPGPKNRCLREVTAVEVTAVEASHVSAAVASPKASAKPLQTQGMALSDVFSSLKFAE